MKLSLTQVLRTEIRSAVRNAGWSEGHRRRVYRWLAALPDGIQKECRSCFTGQASENHECLETLIISLRLEYEADEEYSRTILAPGEELDVGRTDYLKSRGPYWIDRLSDEFHLQVRGGTEYSFIAASPLLRSPYAYTDPIMHVVILRSELFDSGLDVADMYLVHMLIHGTGMKDDIHGPEFRKRFSVIYPWDKPGVITEHDPGTPRRELFRKAKEIMTG